MTATAPTIAARRGVIKPNPAFAMDVIDSNLAVAWRVYRSWRHHRWRNTVMHDEWRRLYANARWQLKAAIDLRRACRPLRIGGE